VLDDSWRTRSHPTTSLNQLPASEDSVPDEVHGSDLFEIIRTTRSMRRLKPDPVPNELIRKILEAGVCAPSGGNMQRWRFLVIRDAGIKQTVGAYYKRAWDEQVAPRYRAGEPAPGMSREHFLRLLDAAEYLAAHIHQAPVWIVPCPEGGTPTRTSGSSIYPAVQNMLLAARALGLGAV
jgi:nitroreductase